MICNREGHRLSQPYCKRQAKGPQGQPIILYWPAILQTADEKATNSTNHIASGRRKSHRVNQPYVRQQTKGPQNGPVKERDIDTHRELTKLGQVKVPGEIAPSLVSSNRLTFSVAGAFSPASNKYKRATGPLHWSSRKEARQTLAFFYTIAPSTYSEVSRKLLKQDE